jgi:hypothetical protein
MSTDTAAPRQRRERRVLPALGAATLVAVVAWVVVWVVAVPVPADQICPAIAPGPPECSAAGRQLAGWLVSGAVAVAYAVAAAVIVTVGRRAPWSGVVALVALVLVGVSAVVGYEGVLGSSALGDLYAELYPFDPFGG